jgi:hypothetical protein
MSTVVSATQTTGPSGDALAAELQAWNSAFSELELPWQWDVDTYRGLLSVAGERDCVSTYVERNQAHLLRVYETAFLRDLVLSTKARWPGAAAR